MKRSIAVAAVLVVVGVFTISCNSQPCANRMDSIRSQRGDPEQVNEYSSSDFYSVTWWYWSKGISYTFEWGTAVTGCDVSTYTFPPIEPTAPPEFKEKAAQSKKLVSKEKHIEPRVI